jgi:ATP phosphoribosyltransferase
MAAPFLFQKMNNNTLRIAIQKGGRLHEESVQLLRNCGIELNNGVNKLRTEALNFPLEVLLLRDDDIPQYVLDGVADVGIVGENVLLESAAVLESPARLGFGKCRLSIALPKTEAYESIRCLEGKRIASSYPRLLNEYLNASGVNAEVHCISGSVEIAPGIGLADAICDLVSSGSTLFTNGLKEVEVLLRSEAVLVSRPGLAAGKAEVLDRLLFRIAAVRKAKRNKYILLNAPNEKLDCICRILPGMKSPTIIPLAIEGWSSVHSVVEEDDFWNIIEALKAEGAQGILVVPIEKMIV